MNPTLMMVDKALQDCAIIYGSLPPAGRDLDLLVSPRDYTDLPPRLGQQGWAHRDAHCVRFGDFTAYAVDLAKLDRWTPSRSAALLLQESAIPLEDAVHLCVPAPHHRLLILARRYAGGMRLDSRKQTLLSSFTGDDWDRARLEVPHWGVGGELDELYAHSVADSNGELDAKRYQPRFSRRSRVVSLSGVDGSGKSTQAHHLQVALDSLGFESAVQWTKITQDPVVRIVGGTVKQAIAKVLRNAQVEGSAPESQDDSGEVRYYPDGTPPAHDVGKRLRRKSRLLTWGWAVVVAFGNGLHHRRTVRQQSARVLICDRYVFDSLVHLHYRYGAAGSLRLQRAIVALLSPRPDCTFFLDVPPAVARARKPEQYLTAELARFSELYHRTSTEVRAIVIDGTRPPEEIAAEIARLSWQQLTEPRRRPVLSRLSPRTRS